MPKAKFYNVDGEMVSTKEIARRKGVPAKFMAGVINYRGIDAALAWTKDTPRRYRTKLYEYNGQQYTALELCGIARDPCIVATMQWRIKHYGVAEAVETESFRNRPRGPRPPRKPKPDLVDMDPELFRLNNIKKSLIREGVPKADLAFEVRKRYRGIGI